MKSNKSPFAIQEKNLRDSENKNDYPTIADLIREQNVLEDHKNSVHRRRDLDSLG